MSLKCVFRSVDDIVADKVKGFLMNSPSPFNILGKEVTISYFKHWYTICKLHDHKYYNLDSKFTVPFELGEEYDVKTFVKDKLKKGGTELLIVVSSDTPKEDVVLDR